MKLIALFFLIFSINVQAAAIYPKALPSSDFEFIVVSTHNINGQITAFNVEGNRKVGGIRQVRKYVDILREKFGEKVVLTHVGNLFGEKNTKSEKFLMLNYIKELNYDAVLVSEQELAKDYELLKEFDLPYITSNVLRVKSGETLFPKELRVEKNGRKFLFLGVYSFKRLEEKYLNPFLPGFYFKDDILSTLELKNAAHKYKPHFSIVLGSFNDLCKSNSEKKVFKWGQSPNCEKKSDIYYFMRKLPKDTVDLIINANGEAATGYIKNTIISQGRSRGHQLGMVTLSHFDQENVLDIKKSHGLFPVEVCQSFFTDGKHCVKEQEGIMNKIFSLFSQKEAQEIEAKFLDSKI